MGHRLRACAYSLTSNPLRCIDCARDREFFMYREACPCAPCGATSLSLTRLNYLNFHFRSPCSPSDFEILFLFFLHATVYKGFVHESSLESILLRPTRFAFDFHTHRRVQINAQWMHCTTLQNPSISRYSSAVVRCSDMCWKISSRCENSSYCLLWQ